MGQEARWLRDGNRRRTADYVDDFGCGDLFGASRVCAVTHCGFNDHRICCEVPGGDPDACARLITACLPSACAATS